MQLIHLEYRIKATPVHFIRKATQVTWRQTDELSESSGESAEAVIPDLEADIRHAQRRCKEQSLGGFHAKRRQKLTGRNAGYLSENSVKIKRAHDGDLGQVFQSQR